MEIPHRYPVIFNPKARSQKGGRVMRFLMRNAHRFALYATNHAGEAEDLAARFAAAGEPVVIAAGGDGTLNEVVCGLAGSNVLLGVLPAGTMNVFAREMGIPFDSLDRALQIIEDGFVQEVDLFEANGAPFVQMAGVGFDALVIEETSWELKKVLGPLAYLVAAVKVLGVEPPRLEIICADGRREEGVAVLAGNGVLYGGQFRFFRHARFGGLEILDSTVCFQSADFVVRADRDVPVQVDGELIGRFPEIRFVEGKNRLRVLAPKDPVVGQLADAVRSRLSWQRSRPREIQATSTS